MQIFNRDNNKFILLLGKGVNAYEYMDDGQKFNEKEDFYSHLNMEDITNANLRAHQKSLERF